VLDVGTGSGVLAIWAAQAGAAKVYAVEYTDMAIHARKMVEQNGMAGVYLYIEMYVYMYMYMHNVCIYFYINTNNMQFLIYRYLYTCIHEYI
jgi:predicted RNA methylase